ncbi:hypothetical protein Vretifemale_2589 [Volvox reticuliferus]|nr:hypothetical protein Vretifemale_2589 [Volvox reticuliferus]
MLCCDTLLSRVLLSYPYGSDLLLLPEHLRLRQIRLLIDWLHASAAVSPFGSAIVKESDLESLLPRQGKRDKAALEYVTRVAQIVENSGRPPSAGLPPWPPSTAVSSSSRPSTITRPTTALSASAWASISRPHCSPDRALHHPRALDLAPPRHPPHHPPQPRATWTC